jgi:hypothetical protein
MTTIRTGFSGGNAALLLASLALSLLAPDAAAITSTVDSTGDSGEYSSMQLNAVQARHRLPAGHHDQARHLHGGVHERIAHMVIATVRRVSIPRSTYPTAPRSSHTGSGPPCGWRPALRIARPLSPTWVDATVEATNVGYHALRIIGGKPVIAYQVGMPDNDLWLATCVADCATSSPTWLKARIEDGPDSSFMPVHQYMSIQEVAGRPVVAYSRFKRR